MKRLTALLLACAAILASYAQAPLRLVGVDFVDLQLSCRYTYDTQGRINAIIYAANDTAITIAADYDKPNHIALTLDTLSLGTLTYDPALQRTTTMHLLGYDFPLPYDAQGRLCYPHDEASKLYTYAKCPAEAAFEGAIAHVPAAIERMAQAVPNFGQWLAICTPQTTDPLTIALLSLGQLGQTAACPVAAHLWLPAPYDPLAEPLTDTYANPFYDIIDARSPRLMDIEAVKPSQQLEQALSESQEREEEWLTLAQFDEFMREAKRYSKADDEDVEQPSALTSQAVTYHYTRQAGTHAKQQVLQVDIVGARPQQPEGLVSQQKLRFIFE